MTPSGQHVRSAAVVLVAAALCGCVQPVRIAPTAAVSTTVAVPGCPPVVIKPAQSALIDFTDFVVHDGVTYSSRPERPQTSTPKQLGPELFRVSCTFSKLNEMTQSKLPDATEHSAGYIPAQSPVFEMTGWPAACRLLAQHDGAWYVYVATIETGDTSMYNECGLERSRPTAEAAP